MENIVRNDKRQKLNREITGIIQKDRIWEQWYDQSIFMESFPKMNQKDYLFNCIGDDEERIIIDNRGMKKISVADFKKMIIMYEKAFTTMHLNKGDVICTIGLSTPEMYAIKYSATTLGLITCNLNVLDIEITDDGKNRLYRQLENANPKMIFTLDILEDKICSVINDKKFDNAFKVSMPLDYSTPAYNPEKLIVSFKLLKDFLSGKAIRNKVSLSDFLMLGDNVKLDDINEIYEEKLPCNISFTSGTTGINKAVLLSHDANNALAFQQKIGDFGYKKGTKQLALVPPFLAFWDSDIVHSVLCLGGENIIELFLDYYKIPKYFKKHEVELGVWSQYLWTSILKLPNNKINQNLKAIIGGERCEVNQAKAFFDKTGIIQDTGFGATEVNTAFSVTHPYCNKIGTAGIPLPFNNVKIVDDSFNDVTYNVRGKLFITGPCLMNGYYNRDDLTKKAIYVDKNGTKWYNTGDYAVMDNDGCLTVLDRYIEPIIINDNGNEHKVNILDLAEEVKVNPLVKNCKMTFYNGRLVLHISLNKYIEGDNVDSVLMTIKKSIQKEFWPHIINIVDELPRTKVGKIDYENIVKIGEKLCSEVISEDRLTLIDNRKKILIKKK